MLLINLVRALLLLAAIGLYHIYIGDFLAVDEGVVVFCISFFGLVLWEIVENYIVTMFNGEDRTTPSASRLR